MADPELLNRLQQGSKAWNRWWMRQPETSQIDLSNADLGEANLIEADLCGADLRGAKLCEANLSGANLSGANLSGADLSETKMSGADLSTADLSNAILSGANLYSATLSGAKLVRANLSFVDLSYVDLSYTNLSRTNLRCASLRQANLSGASLSEANLNLANLSGVNLNNTIITQANWTDAIIGGITMGNLDLQTVIGLETVRHTSPSTIGLDTIYRSYGQIPEVFLRGAGVPETFITNMRALVASMSPIDYYTCFIAYSHYNEDFAKRLYADLQARGVRCWFADEDLKIGDHFHQRIDEAIRLYDKLIIVLSETAVESAWVEREVVAAREKEERKGCEVLFPIRLDEAVMQTSQAWAADVRRRWHIGDFTQWKDHDHYQQAFERLMHDLKAQK